MVKKIEPTERYAILEDLHSKRPFMILVIALVNGFNIPDELLALASNDNFDYNIDINFVIEIVRNGKLSRESLQDMLYEICDSVHASCNNNCPVYYLNGGSVPVDQDDECPYFKSGKRMEAFVLVKTL